MDRMVGNEVLSRPDERCVVRSGSLFKRLELTEEEEALLRLGEHRIVLGRLDGSIYSTNLYQMLFYMIQVCSNMIQVRSNFHQARAFIIHTRPDGTGTVWCLVASHE